MSTASRCILSLLLTLSTAGCFPYLFLPRNDEAKSSKKPKISQPTYREYFEPLSQQPHPIGKIPSDFSGPTGELSEVYLREERGEFMAHLMGDAPGQTSRLEGIDISPAFQGSTDDKLCFRLWGGSDAKHDRTAEVIREGWESGKPWLLFAPTELAELAAAPTWPAPEGATRFDEIKLEKELKENYEDDNGVVRVRRNRFYLACAPRPASLDRATTIVLQMHKVAVADNKLFGYDWVTSDPEKLAEARLESDGIYVWQVDR
ncbi:MAG: hypothetical protein R3B48_19445 [Kofleriaceae bacterium]